MDEGWSHTGEFVAALSSVAGARAFVGTHLITHELANLLDDVQLVVSELTTNAMLHADSRFTVTLEGSTGLVRLRVFDRTTARPVPGIARATDTGGRGLAIVAAVSRSWGVLYDDEGGKSIWAEFAS